MATDADVLALAAHVAVLRQRGIDFEADASVARTELNRLMGSPIDRTYQVSEPLPAFDLSGMRLDASLAEADATRPELRRAETAIKLAGGIKAARRTSTCRGASTTARSR